MGCGSTTTGFEDAGIRPIVFDLDAFERMDRAGVFESRGGKVELIEGMICEMAPQSGDHSDVVSELQGQLYIALRTQPEAGFKVLSQGTLKLDDLSAPEPDVFVARSRGARRYYQASDAVLVIEVSVTSASADKGPKASLYARAGVPELWLVEPGARVIHIHRRPQADGRWAEESTVAEGAVSPLFAPEIRIALDDVFKGV